MSKLLEKTTPPPPEIPVQFLLRFGILIRETFGLPDAGFPASKSNAIRLFQRLGQIRNEDEAEQVMRQDQEGTLALLSAIILRANTLGFPLSLPAISDTKREDTKWGPKGFAEETVWWFFRKAIDEMPTNF